MAFPTSLPYPTGFDNPVTIRAAAALAGAGAWDAAPVVIPVPEMKHLALFMKYTRGGAGGAFDIEVLGSPLSAGTVFYVTGAYERGVIAAGVDVASKCQRDIVTYKAVGAGAEYVMLKVDIYDVIERVEVIARESGNVGAPGTLEIFGYLFK